MAIKQQSGQQILTLLKAGYVRFKREDDGNGLGSIEEVTGLSPASLKEILKHPRLVNIRVKVPLYVLVNDFEAETEDEVLVDDFEEEEIVASVSPTSTQSPMAPFETIHVSEPVATEEEEFEKDLQAFDAILTASEILEVDLLG